MIPQRLESGPWILRHPIKPGTAWTDEAWSAHKNGECKRGLMKFSSRSHANAYRLRIWETLPKALQNQIDAAQRAERGSYLPQDASGGTK